MSIDLGVMGAKVNLVTSGFDRGVKKVRAGFTNMGQKAMHLNQTLELVGRGFRIMNTGINKSLGTFIEAADTAERYRVTLDILLGSQKEGARMFDEMSKFAAKVPFEYEKIMSSATALAGVMDGGVDEVQKWMPMIADLAAVSRLSVEETTGQIIRMYSAGASAADLFRERGITAMLGFTAGARYTAKETREQLEAAFISPTSKFRGAADELAKTWTGLISMLSDRWFLFRNKVMEGDVFEGMKQKLRDILTLLDKFGEDGTLDRWAEITGKNFVGAINLMIRAVGFLVDAWYRVKIVVASVVLVAQTFAEVLGKVFIWLEQKVDKILEKLNKANRQHDVAVGKVNKDGSSDVTQTNARVRANQEAVANIQINKAYWQEVIQNSLEGMANVAKVVDYTLIKIDKSISETLSGSGAEGTRLKSKELSKEASDAVEAMDKALADIAFETQLIGMSEWEAAIVSVSHETLALRDKYQDLFGETSQIEEMIAKFKELKLAQIDADQAEQVKALMDEQAQQMSATLVDDNPYSQELEAINRQYEIMLAKGGQIAQFADQWRNNAKAIADYKKTITSVREVTDSMVTHFADAFAEFAKTGKMNLKALGKALVEELQMIAAQKTARLLMEAAYNGVMALVALARYDSTAAALHGAAASQSLAGAALMGSFVAGSGLAGMAHDGISSIPEDGTWLLKKNERVVDPETNADLKAFLKDGGGGNTIQQNITINGGDEQGILKTLPMIKEMAVEAVNESIASRGSTFKTIQAYAPA